MVEETIERTIVQKYCHRGISTPLVMRVYHLAYERGHASGEAEVSVIFRGLMYDIFHMSADSTRKAKLD